MRDCVGDASIVPIVRDGRALCHEGNRRGSDARTIAIAQQQASDAPAPDYRFARPDVAELTIELATKRC